MECPDCDKTMTLDRKEVLAGDYRRSMDPERIRYHYTCTCGAKVFFDVIRDGWLEAEQAKVKKT